MKIERTEKCQHCTKEFEWEYQASQKLGAGNLDVELISREKAHVYQVLQSFEKDGYKLPEKINIYCPHCDTLNTINIIY